MAVKYCHYVIRTAIRCIFFFFFCFENLSVDRSFTSDRPDPVHTGNETGSCNECKNGLKTIYVRFHTGIFLCGNIDLIEID